MTSGAQQALRRTMEIYSKHNSFCFRMQPIKQDHRTSSVKMCDPTVFTLTDAQVVQRLMQVMEAEKVEYSEDGLAALVFSAEGDHAASTQQSAKYMGRLRLCQWGQRISSC